MPPFPVPVVFRRCAGRPGLRRAVRRRLVHGKGGFAGTGGGSSGTGAAAGQQSGGAGGEIAGRTCGQITGDYDAALIEARTCDLAASIVQCDQIVTVGLDCSCPDAVNRPQADAVAWMTFLRAEYEQAGCRDSGVLCGECVDVQDGYCGPEGHCVSLGRD